MDQSRDLPTHVLRTFVTIVDRGGFTQAADTLGLTQPTVSQQLKKLEALVDQSLLTRNPRICPPDSESKRRGHFKSFDASGQRQAEAWHSA